MKPTEHPQVFHMGNETERIRLGLDFEAEVFTMLTLTDLYSHPMTAIAREYSTNAHDSHIEAGQTRPIEVSLPNTTYPFFVVEDWGVGLSLEEIRTIYSRYGASTKRNSDNVVGMFGLGCKSALSYASSFSVEASKDGWTTIAGVSKDTDGIGIIDILSHEETGNPNGVKITVPIKEKDHSEFRGVAENFFFYWRSGVLVNGEVPHNITSSEHYLELDEDIYIGISRSLDANCYVVQGNVPYPFKPLNDYAKSRRLNSTRMLRVVAYVPIGTVDFVPSREDILHTPETDDTLQLIYYWAHCYWPKWLETYVSGLNDFERIKLVNELHSSTRPWAGKPFNSVRHYPLKYLIEKRRLEEKALAMKGLEGPLEPPSLDHRNLGNDFRIRNYEGKPTWAAEIPSYETWYVRSAHANSSAGVLGVRDLITPEYSYILGFDLKNFVPAHRKRIEAYGVSPPYIVVCSPADAFDWSSIPDATKRVHQWSDVPYIKQNRATSSSHPRSDTTYPLKVNGTHGWRRETAEDIRKHYKLVVYATGSESEWVNQLRRQSEYHQGAAFVRLTKRQVKKFTKTVEHAVLFQTWLKDEQEKAAKEFTEKYRQWLQAEPIERAVTIFLENNCDKIRNSKFKGFSVPKPPNDYDKVLSRAQHYGVVSRSTREKPAFASKHREFALEFPLIANRGTFNSLKEHPVEDVILYVNAKARQKKSKKDEDGNA